MKSSTAPVSVNTILARTWIALTLTGLAVGLVILGILAIRDSQESRRETVNLVESVQSKIARRLAAEILLPNRGSEAAIAQQMEQEYGFLHVRSSPETICDTSQACVVEKGEVSTAQFANPFLNDAEFLQIDFAHRPLISFFEPREFLISLFPIVAIFLVGVTIQMRVLRVRIADPITKIQQFADPTGVPPTDWPLEIQRIAFQLRDSFKRRDAEILAQLSRGIIHDIRNYLHSVSIATEMAKSAQTAAPQRAEALVSNLIATSETNLKRVTNLIDRTLDASNELELNIQSFEIKKLLQETTESFLPQFKKSGIEFTGVNVAPSIHYTGDRLHLSRVIFNLLQNAVDAIAQSNSKVRQIALACTESASDVLVEVEDSGPGLPDTLDLSFSRIKSSKKHGTGLGLFIAHRIVEQHGGKLRAQRSASLGGAKFSVTLPQRFPSQSEVQYV